MNEEITNLKNKLEQTEKDLETIKKEIEEKRKIDSLISRGLTACGHSLWAWCSECER